MNKRLIGRMAIMLIITGVLFGAVGAFQLYKPKMIRGFILAAGHPPAAVTTAKAEMQPWQGVISSIGSLRAVRGVDLATEVSGLVRSVEFRSGEDVAAGQLLVQLNADAERANLRALEVTADLAQTVLERDRQQFAIGAISKAVLDADEHDLRLKRRQIEQQAAVVDRKAVQAPFAGRLGITTLQPGQYLNPGDRIVSLQQIDRLYVDFSLPQQDVARVHRGQTVKLSVDAWPGKSFTAQVSTIDPRVDSATRTLQLQAVVPNPRRELLPGMYVTVEVAEGKAKPLLTVPTTAVAFNPYGATVFVVKPADGSTDGKANPSTVEQRFVKTGSRRGDQISIIEGVTEGEEVVTSGQLKLRNGDAVQIDNSIKPSNDPAPRPVDR
jgi:membrane fusion protein (multidrug efflux system)